MCVRTQSATEMVHLWTRAPHGVAGSVVQPIHRAPEVSEHLRREPCPELDSVEAVVGHSRLLRWPQDSVAPKRPRRSRQPPQPSHPSASPRRRPLLRRDRPPRAQLRKLLEPRALLRGAGHLSSPWRIWVRRWPLRPRMRRHLERIPRARPFGSLRWDRG
jgi:hypothetical protein